MKLQELKEEITKANQEIKKLDSKVTPPKKKCGRKQKKYYYDTGLVDDAELLRLIDGEFITISKLEKLVRYVVLLSPDKLQSINLKKNILFL